MAERLSSRSPLEAAYRRILPRINVDEGGCWNWTGASDPNGYGNVWGDDRYRKVHAVTWEYANGPVPAGLELDHKCRNVACCNPDHLEAVTHRENVRRGKAMTRSCTHPDSEFCRRKKNGWIIYCRACRRERRRAIPKPARGPCAACGKQVYGNARKRHCDAVCHRRARTARERLTRGGASQ